MTSRYVAAQIISRPDLDADADWTIVQDPDGSAIFGFDYSDLGIQSAPNGEGTTGLRLAANIQ